MQLQLAEQLRKRQDLALAVERARGIAEAEFPYKQPLPVAGRDIPLPEPVAKQRQELNAPQPPALLPPDQEAQRIRIAKAGQHPTFRFINTVDEQGNPIQKAVPVQPGQEYQMAPTADMRNKQVARNKTLASVNAIESLSKEVINLKGVAQRAKAIGSSIEAALGNNPKYRTYQDARKALAGNLAVLQQGSRPSDADITAVWLPLVPDVFNDTNESAKMKWDLIKISSGMPVAGPEPTPIGPSKNPYR